ncbi:alkaline phosphatase [Thermococcus barophilus]|uniref:Alkaline phosphatase IV n=1 Tax=Thermococcus barophilus TaxID=55802 RepID=A0A0S1XF34_THEBA|nr:alkaline phosphatase [Thermococcus barophilus]ALM76338.1 Alkaline phosphatase IV [Thermococcus barophilus]
MKKAFGLVLIIGLLVFAQAGIATVPATTPASGVKNIILIIGDGMGFAHIQLTRIVYGKLNLEDFPYTGYEMTYSLSGEVTDSAAAATALATGIKTYNGMISTVTRGDKMYNLTTLIELAQFLGKSTGLVTTTRITHATPAAFGAHVEDRDMEAEIAKQLIEHRINVLFGGGKKKFDEATLELAKKYGYEVIFDKEGLEKANGEYVLGLFASSHIPYVLDRTENDVGLLDMTKKAIELLERNPNGFFLMIEAGRIDHASHGNDIAAALAETKELDDVVGYVLEYAKKRGDTLVIVTGDHETGGLAVGINYGKVVDVDKILSIKKSASFMAAEIKKGGDIKEVVKKYTGIELTDDEVEYIKQMDQENPIFGMSNAIGEIISKKVGVTFASHKHTGELIPLLAYGPGADNFVGFHHHIQTSKLIAKLMIFGVPRVNILFEGTSSAKGDLNGDYKVDEKDAYIALMMLLGENVDTEFEQRADMDNNGIIDLHDVMLILQEA